MAMMECPECGRRVSDYARQCPECAYPIRDDAVELDEPAPQQTSNAVAGVASFFIPGLGQLVQGRIGAAIGNLIGVGLLWVFTLGLLGWVGHIASAWGAATWKSKAVQRDVSPAS